MASSAERIRLGTAAPIRYLNKLAPLDRIIEGGETLEALLEVAAEVAAVRRAAVRELRMQGWKLAEIADELGLTKQRVAQIERGR